MSKHHSRKSSKRLYRQVAGQVAIAALASSGILQPLLPVLAAGTAADTPISNTATATYSDGVNTFNATSNTVSITVAPVSGITVKSTGITDSNGGAVEQGDSLTYSFDVTNIGNKTADIYIPTAPITSGLNAATVTYQVGSGAVQPLPTNGIITGVAADQVVKVFVTATVQTSGVIAGDNITVTLGNTGPNDNSAATQNVIDGIDNANADEVRTVFALNPADPAIPANNKEASASQFIKFATSATPQAFALIKKTVGNVAPGTVAGNDDEITYNLDLSVLSTSPSGSLTPAALEGTNIRLEGSTAKRILVSDAVPAGTVLEALPTAPAGWAVVYSIDAVDTTLPISTTGGLPAANWLRGDTAPNTLDLSTVKRVGYIYENNGTVALPASQTPLPLPTGYTLPAPKFAITVVTSGLPLSGGTVSNIAQVFGQTQGDASGKVVYDESGDANASNFDDFGNPGPAFDPTSDTGKADPTTQGVDGNGNNTGAGIKGEVIQTIINGTVAPTTDSIFNGPNGFPTAVGPTDVNDDFTNASTAVPAGAVPGVNIDETQSASFTNTVNNPAAATATLSNVTVQPIAPSQAETADGITTTGQYGTNSSIPLGTIVVIKDNAIAPTKTATYTYAADPTDLSNPAKYTFNLTSGTPVNFGGLAPNASVNYVVEVTLPTGTVTPLTAVAIPVIAFPDNDPTNAPGYTGESTNNITLNRVYTGYVRLLKEARILDVDKTTPIQDWTSAPTLTSRVAPGQYIEYRITYQNISSPATGTGNVILNARNFTLIEDGTGANSWATNTLHQQSTTFSRGTVNYFTGSTLIANLDPIDGRDVTRYENVVSSPLAPNELGTFKFRRLVK